MTTDLQADGDPEALPLDWDGQTWEVPAWFKALKSPEFP